MPEIILILIIIFIFFGVGKLPQVGEAMGKAIRSFKTSAAGEDDKAKKEEASAEAAPKKSAA
ncbi:MAG: twin-arginine translocase TatA/TatE family subunit [Anaerolineales bacterium]|nr:twin-arginine translocase TatA/TatE family subunit [Anaerolineales bacterium]